MRDDPTIDPIDPEGNRRPEKSGSELKPEEENRLEFQEERRAEREAERREEAAEERRLNRSREEERSFETEPITIAKKAGPDPA